MTPLPFRLFTAIGNRLPSGQHALVWQLKGNSSCSRIFKIVIESHLDTFKSFWFENMWDEYDIRSRKVNRLTRQQIILYFLNKFSICKHLVVTIYRFLISANCKWIFHFKRTPELAFLTKKVWTKALKPYPVKNSISKFPLFRIITRSLKYLIRL